MLLPTNRYLIRVFYTAAIAFFYCLAGCRDMTPGERAAATKPGDASVSGKSNGQTDTGGYKVFQSIQPEMLPGCKQVTVCILEDKSLTGIAGGVRYYPDIHAAQLALQSDEAIFNPEGPAYKPAILVIKDKDGSVLRQEILGVPCARIDTAYLDENKTSVIYLFTLDYSTDMGSYNGPATYFVRFSDTGMVNYNRNSSFPTTLKSAWAMRYTTRGLEVWKKLCRPADNDEFTIVTEKSRWSADSFKSVRVVNKGFWENEDDGLKEFFDSFPE